MKRFFVGGLTALLPTILTLWIITGLVSFVRNYIAVPVTHAIHWVLITNKAGKQILESCTSVRIFTPEHVRLGASAPGEGMRALLDEAEAKPGFLLDLEHINTDAIYAELAESIPPYIGLALSFVLIFVAGFLLRSYFVSVLFRQGERILQAFPLVRSIYGNAKKLVEFFFAGKEKREFKGVVAVPYPSPGIYTVGFVTSAGLETINKAQDDELVSVFLPSSPTPMTGYLAFVRKSDILQLSMSFDQAMGLIISGGAIVPDAEMSKGSNESATENSDEGVDKHDLDEMPSLLAPAKKDDAQGLAKEEPLAQSGDGA